MFILQISIDHNVYQAVQCHEKHQLIPFSNNGTGAVTTTNVQLNLVNEETFTTTIKHDDLDDITTRAPLLFDNVPTAKPTSSEIKHSREFLKQMCSYGFPNIKREFINSFSKFLNAAKSLSSSALHQLLARANGICSNGEYVLCENMKIFYNTICLTIS